MKINTPIFNDQQKRFALILLSLFHIFIITASNYFVQIPFEINLKLTALGFADDFSFHSTWGTLTFPFIFLATVSVVFSNGQYQGLGALSEFNMFVFRIAFASFCAYVFGQLLDVLVFNRLRQLKTWWIAPSSSMTFGSLADTFMFFCVAFYKSSDPFMAEHWFSLGFVDYLFKLFVGIVLFVPAYGVVLSMILRKLQSLASSRQFA